MCDAAAYGGHSESMHSPSFAPGTAIGRPLVAAEEPLDGRTRR
jgi:hypothetical protein